MAITYTWTVTGVKTTTQGQYANAVVQTYWKKIGTDDDGCKGTFAGATPFTAADVPPEQFVPFDQLTEEIVLGWIQNQVNSNPTYVEHIDGVIAEQIQREHDPVVEQPLPWNPEPSPTPPTP